MDNTEEIMHMLNNYSDLVLEATAWVIEILDADDFKTNINSIAKEYSYLS